MPLYEVAILEKPTKNAADNGESERLVLGPQTVIARDEHSAAVVAARSVKVDGVDPMRMQVLVRPFA